MPPISGSMQLQAELQRRKGKSEAEIAPSLVDSCEWNKKEAFQFKVYQAFQVKRERAVRNLQRFALVGFIPPVASFVIGAALFWAIRGFRL